jgi:hypothetical protein
MKPVPTVVVFEAVDDLRHNGRALEEDHPANGAGRTDIALRRWEEPGYGKETRCGRQTRQSHLATDRPLRCSL